MNKANENMQRLLDGELPAAEMDAMLRQIQGDPALQKEFEDLKGAVELLERQGRLKPPPAFTASVMARLPGRREALPARVKRFFFGSRVLRWNVAAAMALVLVTVIATALLMKQLTDRSQGAPYTAAVPGSGVETVRLTFVAPAAARVAVAGDFNKWRTDADLMRREDGMWTIELKLKPGIYSYMFIVDGGKWVTDPRAESYRDDGFGFRNAVMRVNL